MPLTRVPTSVAIDHLELPVPIGRKLSRYLDRVLHGPRTDRTALRRTVQEVATILLARGNMPDEVASMLERAVATHAAERGFQHLALVTGIPRHAYLAAEVAHWAALTCRRCC